MQRQHVYYLIIALGIVIVAMVGWIYFPSASDSLDPPGVVEQRLRNGSNTEEKVKAARDLVRHGDAARQEIRRAVKDHQEFKVEVLDPLLQASMKTRDYRSLPELVNLMEHPDPIVRGRAGAAVRKIMGIDFGFRANAPPEQRAEIVAAIRRNVHLKQSRLKEFYSDQTE